MSRYSIDRRKQSAPIESSSAQLERQALVERKKQMLAQAKQQRAAMPKRKRRGCGC